MKDAFWSNRIAIMPPDEWASAFDEMQADPAGWMSRAGIEATPQLMA